MIDFASYFSVDSFGTVAAVITTVAFGLQAFHTLKTRDVSGISLGMYLAFFVGVALWIFYGVMLHAAPLIISQTITLAFAGVVLVMKLRAEPPLKTKSKSTEKGGGSTFTISAR